MAAFTVDWPARWAGAESFPDFLQRAKALLPLWEGTYAAADPTDAQLAAFGNLPRGLRMLALNADWCLDSASIIPLLARVAERVPGVELRLLERDAHLDLMDAYLTNGGRSIPLVILLDEAFSPLGHWGPRPGPLQAWVRANLAGTTPEERHKEQRRWYAKDRGATTLREILALAGGPA